MVRLARALASPVGVIVTIPLLVVAVGLTVLLVGRDATRTATDSMARRQLAEQSTSVQLDVVFALDQAAPLMERLRALADPARPAGDALVRLHDLLVGRPGVAYVTLSFPDGTFRGAQHDADGTLVVQESTTARKVADWYSVRGDQLAPLRTEPTAYDPHTRPFYQLATRARARAWTQPYVFFRSHETGITCTEPIYDGSGALAAVATVDFDVGALSDFVARPALDQARSVVFTRDGTILAYPAGATSPLPPTEQLLHASDLHDGVLDAVVRQVSDAGSGAGVVAGGIGTSAGAGSDDATRFAVVATPDGPYLAAIAPIGGKRAGVSVPLDWFIATFVPERTLLGPTRKLEKSSAIASAGALAIAVGLAFVLAWNLVRMRRQVAKSRAEARSAEARARELGSYRLVAKLGAGGMGEVWRSEHRLLARSAAIKLIRAEALYDPESSAEIRERFRREAQTLASMTSRHTIAIFDYGVTAEGVFYYVMELLDGLDLESLVVDYGPQPAARVIRMLVQACASLAEAHDAGMLHRDIKPPNLFTCRAADEVDIVKLLDFGIVQTVNDPAVAARPIALDAAPIETGKLTQLGAMLGTPGFMAPEQILGMKLDGRADLYALGCVAWWLLTGHEVFSRDVGEAKLLHRHIYEDVPPLGQVARGWVPRELEHVLAACLAKDADQRPPDARTLAAQLKAIHIPPEQAWTEEHALAWWRDYRPKHATSNLPSAQVQVIMPGSTDARAPVSTSSSAFDQTIAGPATLAERARR